MSVAALVLAAGGGSRFSAPTHKLLTLVGGRPLVARAIEAACGAELDATAVVFGAVDLSELSPPGVTLLENPNWQSGLASSLQVGIAWCEAQGHDAVVVGLGDTPNVPSSAWRAVANADAPVAVANFDGRLCPPVRLGKSIWGELPRDGDRGARELWHRPGTIEVPCEGDPFDVDTVEDLAALSDAEP